MLSLIDEEHPSRARRVPRVGHWNGVLCIGVLAIMSYACAGTTSLPPEAPRSVQRHELARVVYTSTAKNLAPADPAEGAQLSPHDGAPHDGAPEEKERTGLDDDAAADAASEAAIAEQEDLVFLVPTTLPRGATVLHIGDSFAGALGRPLNRELGERGVRGVLKYETGTYIATWAWDRRVPRYVTRYRPDLVLITLGANEVDAARPESRGNAIRRLVHALGQRPCVWIAPPLWEGARADLLRVIEDNCAPCQYLDSNQLVPNLARLRDKIHPTGAARSRWAKAVMSWLEVHPIDDLEGPWVSLHQAGHSGDATKR